MTMANLVVVLNTINGIKVFDQIWVMTAGGPNYASRPSGRTSTASPSARWAVNSQLGYAATIAIVISRL